MPRVLLVEDDPSIAESLKINFKVNGFEAVHAPSLKVARGEFARNEFDILLLDINLPDGTGFDLCREVREAGKELPILMLTAKTDEESAVRGLALGATDYIRKPFGVNELIARMNRFLNRDIAREKAIVFDGLRVSPAEFKASWKGEIISLTRRELDILCLLIRRAGSPVSRAEVLSAIDNEGEIFDGTLNSHISNLRTKLKKATGGKIGIAPVYGIGYQLEKKGK